ncbi:twin-arginine translocase TatA/TatE family subunit [Streptomyces sp. NBC_01283]|uniref:twin-arginine translocase TatA/TatE family subunit n=1 Tax=Streptomyces sp. NBC_01283 TaxID=2903812 RepID=UPI00352D514F|nr:twin-arginine translocase TatA/TatE family subunit [Streptomyces sp. NBC_01283]
MFGLSEIAIILTVVILVFGAKNLPELARSAGKSARILNAESKAMKEKENRSKPPSAGRQHRHPKFCTERSSRRLRRGPTPGSRTRAARARSAS